MLVREASSACVQMDRVKGEVVGRAGEERGQERFKGDEVQVWNHGLELQVMPPRHFFYAGLDWPELPHVP